jgi:hypothetical protein
MQITLTEVIFYDQRFLLNLLTFTVSLEIIRILFVCFINVWRNLLMLYQRFMQNTTCEVFLKCLVRLRLDYVCVNGECLRFELLEEELVSDFCQFLCG